jgi:hypothetical protein
MSAHAPMSNSGLRCKARKIHPGSGRYPEPKWLGMIQHDMMLWDHRMPGPDGTVSAEQRSEADINIEFQSNAKFADQAMNLFLRLGESGIDHVPQQR